MSLVHTATKKKKRDVACFTTAAFETVTKFHDCHMYSHTVQLSIPGISVLYLPSYFSGSCSKIVRISIIGDINMLRCLILFKAWYKCTIC